MDTQGNVYELEQSTMTAQEQTSFRQQLADGDLIEVDTKDMTPEQKEKFESGDNPAVEPDESQLGQMLHMMQQMQKKRRLQEARDLKDSIKKVKNRAKNKKARKARKKNRK